LGKYGYTSRMTTDEKLLIAVIRISESYKKESSLIFKKKSGLTYAQYTILRVLEGSEDGQNTMGNVSKVMHVTGSNITPIAKRMERNGLLIKKNDPGDDRLIILEITPKGRQIIKDIESEKNTLIGEYLTGYTDGIKKKILVNLRRTLHRPKT